MLGECAIVKFPIAEYGKGTEKVGELYENTKLLVFTSEPWHILAGKAVALNEKLQYALIRYDHNEYLILAEKRLGEFKARLTPGKDLKTLLLMTGEQLKDLKLYHPLLPDQIVPTVVYNQVTSTYGTGLNLVVPGHTVEGLKVA